MLGLFVLLSILVGSTYQYEVTSFYDLISKTRNWTHCCNDPFVPQHILDQAEHNTNLCFERFPNNLLCFDHCWMRLFGILDRRERFVKSALLEYLGKDVVLGDENDWKKNVTERFVSECLAELTNSTGFCNSDSRRMGVCYWKKMFEACPVELNGGTCNF
ncbi:hypothetical protein ACFFRR_010606 [Megaselia abdita]